MIGFSLKTNPPIAAQTVVGKIGRFWQVVTDDSRSMTSQVLSDSEVDLLPPQISSFEKSF
jgi:hypothetical protein